MKIEFTKMHGLGNDFIVLDCRKKKIRDLSRVLIKLADRRFGVGFDQALILLDSKKADFRMDIYNGDGGRVEMCGNGVRCFARYVWSRGLSRKKRLEIETLAGIIRPERAGDLVRVDMGEPILEGSKIPTAISGEVVEYPLAVGASGETFNATCVSMGNPHCVIFVDDVDNFPVDTYGPVLENDIFFPNRTNVEFVEVASKKRLRMRVWERAAGETLACGTGACATLVAASITKRAGRKATVELRGGKLEIEWAKDNHVYMTGPAVEVFTGTAVV